MQPRSGDRDETYAAATTLTKTSVCVVEPERVADLMGGDRQKVDSVLGVTARRAEDASRIQRNFLQQVRRVLLVLGVVAWGRIGEPAAVGGPVVELDVGLRDAPVFLEEGKPPSDRTFNRGSTVRLVQNP
jgi:hypothetical protein